LVPSPSLHAPSLVMSMPCIGWCAVAGAALAFLRRQSRSHASNIQTLADTPEECGLSSAGLQRLDTFFREQYVDTGKIPGAIIAVARHGKLAHLSAMGDAVVGERAMNAQDTIFRWFSMTKPITAAALMTFWEEGKFQLKDPIEMYLPDLAGLQVAEEPSGDAPVEPRDPCRLVTIRDLLTHSAGMTYGIFGDSLVDKAYRDTSVLGGEGDLIDNKEFVRRLGKVPLMFDPGTKFHYSVAIDVIGRLVEVLGGDTLDRVLKSRILDPLKMSRTTMAKPADQAHLATLYTPGEDGLMTSPMDGVGRSTGKRQSGGGGLCGPINDYVRFGQMLLNKGHLEGAVVLGPRTVELMTANHLADGNTMETLGTLPGFSEMASTGVGYGLGGSVVVDPVAVGCGSKGTYSWGGFGSTLFYVDYKEDVVAVFMTQLTPSTKYPDLRNGLRSIVMSTIL